MRKVVVLASGGLDSTTLLWDYAQKVGAQNVFAFSVNYGQRHSVELDHVCALVHRLHCAHRIVDAGNAFLESKSSLIDARIPLASETYEQQSRRARVIPSNVELRNLVLISLAASYAMQIDADTVAIGAHASDFAYPDCSPRFLAGLQDTIFSGSAEQVTLEAPLLNTDKREVIELGMSLGVPYELTWSCYSGGAHPCGRCPSCLDRARAFREAGYPDPAESVAMSHGDAAR